MKVWIIEDSEADVFLIRESLNRAGFRYPVTIASDGEKALALIDDAVRNHADVGGIILDLNLTTHSGFEILRRLRATRELAAVSVVILTSSDSPQDRLQAQNLGALAYFRKPLELDEFMRIGGQIADVFQGAAGRS